LYRELSQLAERAAPGLLTAGKVFALLDMDTSQGSTTTTNSNAGNAITNDFKYHLKLARHHGVHVSPTILIDGLPDATPQSAWTLDEWKQHLKKCEGWEWV
jgi:hypothetical protein